MNQLKVMRQKSGDLLDAVRLRRGMPVRMKDGRTGKVAFVSGGDVHVDLDGANPHCTGIVVKRASVQIKDGMVVGDLASRLSPKVSIENGEVIVRLPGARLGTKTPQSRVVDLRRSRLEAEWKCAPED